MPAFRPLLERFVEKIKLDPETGCWLWVGCTNMKGYGSIKLKRSVIGAHQASWLLFKGELDPSLEIDHFHCRRRNCVNPSHLRQITHFENTDHDRRKTHCEAGHSYADVGFYVLKTKYGTGKGRSCKLCAKIRAAAQRGLTVDQVGSKAVPNRRTYCLNGHLFSKAGFIVKRRKYKGEWKEFRHCKVCIAETKKRHNKARRLARNSNRPWRTKRN